MQKSTTYSERRKLRAEVSRALGYDGTKPQTKAGKAFLRARISQLRKEKQGEEWRDKILTSQQGGEAAPKPYRPIWSLVEERTRQKAFGGAPRNDNPQTRARDARFAKEKRRTELEGKSGTDLRDIMWERCVFNPGPTLHSKDPELYVLMRHLYYETPNIDSLFTLKQKNELIEVILKAETLLNGPE